VLDRGPFFPLTLPTVSPPHIQLPLHPPQPRSPSVTRTQTVEFAPSPQVRARHQMKPSVDHSIKRQPSVAESRMQPGFSNAEGHAEIASKSPRVVSCRIRLICLSGSATFTQPTTSYTHHSSVPATHRGLGGFPMPLEIISSIVHKFFPNLEQRIRRTVTIPVSQTLTSQHVESGQQAAGSRSVPYISFNALVGRNSTFHDLSHEQIEELCGIEFKALNCLVWIVPCVRFHQSPRLPLTLIIPCLAVLLDPPGYRIFCHCTIHVSSEVERGLRSPQSAFRALASVVCALQQLEYTMVDSPLQVFIIPGHFRIHEFRDVVGRPIHDSLPTSLPTDSRRDVSNHCWEHGICESSHPCSQHVVLTCYIQPVLYVP